eukprot:gene8761-33624_t
MSLRHLKRVFVSFTPGDTTAVSAREFLQRITGDKAKKSNPACDVKYDIAEEGIPGKAFVELTFNDNTHTKLFTSESSANQINVLIDKKGADLEMKAIMAEVKFDPSQMLKSSKK